MVMTGQTEGRLGTLPQDFEFHFQMYEAVQQPFGELPKGTPSFLAPKIVGTFAGVHLRNRAKTWQNVRTEALRTGLLSPSSSNLE